MKLFRGDMLGVDTQECEKRADLAICDYSGGRWVHVNFVSRVDNDQLFEKDGYVPTAGGVSERYVRFSLHRRRITGIRQMKILIAPIALIAALATPALAGSTTQRDAPTTRFYTPDGKSAGTASTYGNQDEV